MGVAGVQAVVVHVPQGKIHVYNYSAEVKAGQNEFSSYASKLQVRGRLIHKRESSDSDYFKFHDVETTVYNGAEDGKVHGDYKPLGDAVKDFEEPVLLVYDNLDNLRGIRIQEKEAVWSKNMKMSLISLMGIQVQGNTEALKKLTRSTSYQTNEKTIRGHCQVSYSLRREMRAGRMVYYLRKYYEPKSCSDYVQHEAHDVKTAHCKIKPEEDFVTFSKKLYQFELTDDYFLLKKIISHEKLSYLPYSHRSSGVQYIETSQTFEFEKVINASELALPDVNFKSTPIINDISFNNHDVVASREHYFGRNAMKSGDKIDRVKNLLILIVDRLKENPIDISQTDAEHKGLLLDLHHTIATLDSESMYLVYKHFNSDAEKENMIRNLFLEMVPHTGSYAAWNFTKNMIANDEFPDESIVVDMLTNLPMFVSNPNEEFVKSMLQFRNLHQLSKSTKIVHAGVLSYSILLHKAYKNVGNNAPEYLRSELESFFERIKHEPTYESKIVYMMAMRNVEVGNISAYLLPIINGMDVFEVTAHMRNVEKYRRAAMWAVVNSIHGDEKFRQNNPFWQILSNNSEPFSLRLTAYEILVPRNPNLDLDLLMRVHSIMSDEQDEHLFNFHYTTMKNIAESTDPCNKGISDLARKVLRLTQSRKVFSSALSSASVFDYFDDKYGYGKTLKIATGINEASGIPQFGYYETITTFLKSRLDSAVYWNVDGVNLNMIISLVKNLFRDELDDAQTPNEISDEKVRNLLRQTYGHKLLDKHIHVEFWSVNKGYVTNVDVYSESGLSNYLKKYVTSYKPRNFMDVKEKFYLLWLNFSFFNQHKIVTATDMGIPVIFQKEFPTLSFMKVNPNIYPLQTIVAMKLEFEAKMYHHGRYEMKFYNPFAGIFQCVRRDVSMHLSLPADLTISLNLKTYNWKIALPRNPKTRFSVAGINTYTINRVEISGDFNGILKSYCSTCNNQVEITKGPSYKHNYMKVVHSKELGLDYSQSIYDCETHRPYTIEYEEIFRVFNTKENNVDKEEWATVMLKMHHALFNFIHAPYASTCGKSLNLSPSTIHPTSHIEINWRFNMKNYNGRITLRVDGSIDTKAASANDTVSYWDFNFDADLSLFVNDVKLQLTKRTQEEKNYKICLAALKEYPNFFIESMALKQETNTEITFDMGYTDSEFCSFDASHTGVTVAIKGELLDEQIEQMAKNVKPGSCFKNPKNSLDLDITQYFDWNCLYEAVRCTTMRNYTIDVGYKNIPQEFLAILIILDDYLRYDRMLYLSYSSNHTEPGTIKILATYPMSDNYGNLNIMNPYFTYSFLYKPEDPEIQRTDLVLDNIGFSSNFLIDYYKGEIRPCIAHANDVITDLNQTLPMDLKNWTLLSGDHELMTYAVFVKSIKDKVSVKIYAGMHVLEILPEKITFDGMNIENYEKGLSLPSATESETYYKLLVINQLLVVETDKLSKVKIFYTPYNVVVLPYIILDRNIDGICGHMGSTSYVQQVPLIYDN
ncbi:uncharacterized protein LOC106645848 [Copidosoma floridanum]|uniref:uncharacterized protein LOC106645848 n=1 Tax=Copidosoma floridanum TaxID=29053 RepID=UPI0006C94BA8|nr:uncharacterized protein LOC106645848 [Copidosoma floridanum]